MMARNDQAEGLAFLSGGGELGERLRSFDWSKSPLGPPQTWPQSLKTAVRIMLTSRQPIWIGWGKELIYLYNDPYKSIIGGKHPQALGQPTRVVWREIWDDIAPLLAKAMTGDEGTYVESQLLIMERYGYPEETYYTFSYSPIPDDDGTAGGIICANTDDTRRVIGERQLALLRDLAASGSDARTWQEACKRSARAMESNPRDIPFALIYVADADATTLSLAARSGIQDGHPIAPPKIDVAANKPWPIAEVMRTHGPVVLEDLASAIVSEGKTTLPMGAWQRPPRQAVALPIAAMGSAERGAGVLIVGLNPYRKFDDNYRNFLNLAAGQISASIANAQAYEEERRRVEALAELDRAKTIFFSNVSHEFRTPLTLMLAPLQETISNAAGVLPHEAVEELTLVHRNGLRLLKLVNTLLDFSRIEAGRVKAEYELTDLSALTIGLASVFRSAIEKAGLRLVVDCPPLSRTVPVDRNMWEKVVLNLLSNAFKFTLDGQITVTMRETGGWAELRVSDTGSGIPQDQIPRLFERFHRVEGTKGRTHEGTGIGLALVQELVKLQGGTIDVQSDVDRGSIFTVRIPMKSAQQIDKPRGKAADSAMTSALPEMFVNEALRWLPDAEDQTAQLGEIADETELPDADTTAHRQRIVLADDNADMRQYMRRLLSRRYEVEAVADGNAALAAIQRKQPVLVVSDVMMPNLDGFGLLKAIRGSPETANLPVILLSARAGEEATLEGLAAGADEYLVKPFSAREFLGRVTALLERKRFQNVLAAMDDTLRMALTAAKMAAWEWDPDSDEIVISKTVAKVFGLPAGSTLHNQKEGFALVHPDDREKRRSMLFQAIENQTNFHSSFRIIRPIDGAVAWMEEHGVARKEPSTGKVRAAGVVMNVTERRVEEELRSRLAAVVESSDDAIITKTLEGIITTWNAGAEKIFGYTPQEVIGKPVTILMPPDRVDEEPGILARLRNGQRIDHYETIRMHKDGTRLDISLSVSPIRDSTGRVIGAAKIARDITARKRIEAALSEETRILDLLNKTGSVIASKLETQSLVQSVTDAAKELTGAEFGAFFYNVINDKGEAYLLYTLSGAPREAFEKFGIPRNTPVFETTFRGTGILRSDDITKDPRYGTMAPHFGMPKGHLPVRSYLAVPVISRSGDVIGGLFFGHSEVGVFTERAERLAAGIAAQAAVAIDNARLFERVKKASEEREALLDAEKAARTEAERASRLKDDFLATLSHELRTPLNAILGWSQILRAKAVADADLAEGLDVIERNTRVQTQLIEDLLDMSRIVSGKIRLDVQQVDVGDVIKAAVASIRHSADAKDIRLQVVLDPLAGPVRGDPARLQQCFWNLLSNAVKFTPKQGRIQVTLERVNSHLEICVVDNGQGISPDFLPHLFERFRQADASTTRRHGGLGLGLSIVKHLVELHGGMVRAKSAGEGKGATFCIELPLMVVHSREQPIARAHPRSAAHADLQMDHPSLKGVTVLAVDDEADARQLIKRVLEDCGARVLVAASSEEALELLEQDRPNMIISDIGMPGEDGYAFIGKVRSLSDKEGGNIPAAALTAFARSEDRTRALRAGFQTHVSKPVEPAELAAVVASLTSRR